MILLIFGRNKMLIKIWDFLFTRRVWVVIEKAKLFSSETDDIPYGYLFVLQDQFGNIKKKKVSI